MLGRLLLASVGMIGSRDQSTVSSLPTVKDILVVLVLIGSEHVTAWGYPDVVEAIRAPNIIVTSMTRSPIKSPAM